MYSLSSSIIILSGFAFLSMGIEAQSSQKSPNWELHHPYGLFRAPAATAIFPATNATGRSVGSYNVEASCNNDIVSINATLSAPPDLEIIRLPKTLASQVDHRSVITASLNGGAPLTTISILDEDNAVSVYFTTPDFEKSSGGAVAVLAWMLNGVKPLGSDEALYRALTLRIEAVAKRSTAPNSPELVRFTFEPQDSSFQAFATECRHQLLGHEQEPNAVLSETTDRAVKMLPASEATQLQSLIDHFDEGLRTNDELALNQARTMLVRLNSTGPRARCSNNNKHDCESMQALSDVDTAMTAVRQKRNAKVAADHQAANLLAPAGTPLKLVFPDKLGSDQITNGMIVSSKLATSILNSGKLVADVGTVVHLRSVVIGMYTGFKVMDIVVNGETLPLFTSACQVSLTADPGNSGYSRPPLEPGQRPFHHVPHQTDATRSIEAGSSCSVNLSRPLSRR